MMYHDVTWCHQMSNNISCMYMHTRPYTHTLMYIIHTYIHTLTQQFSEMETSRAQRFMLPLFGNLGRAISATQVNSLSPRHFASFSNPSSMTDLSISPPLSPNGLQLKPVRPTYMPHANRRQRRASLVSILVAVRWCMYLVRGHNYV